MPSNPPKASGNGLAVVIPVYNEELRLDTLLDDWLPVFEKTGVDYRVILVDDGSKDNSLKVLQQRQIKNPQLDVHTQPNSGHGPAILKGYRLALDAEWVFQIDSDHQLAPEAFEKLWGNKDQHDFLLAGRKDKNASGGRQWVSLVSTKLVYLFYGRGIKDVNSPYRLMRATLLQEALQRLPDHSFAPNVLLTGWFVSKKTRLFTTEVELRTESPRRSRLSPHILKGALRSSLQTILFRIRI